MAKLTLNDIVTGYGNTTAYNANNTLIENALENTISRDGTSPNTMSANLDMNSNRIVNVTDGEDATDAVTLQQLQGITAVSTGSIPSQTGHSGKHLKTDGSVTSWNDVASAFMDTVLDDADAAAVVETLRGSLSSLAAQPADDDEVILRDTSATTGKRHPISQLIKSVLDTARTFTANHTFSGILGFSGANTHSGLETFSTAPLLLYGESITGAHKNLLIFNAVAQPNYQLTITADEIVVRDTSGYARLITSFSETLDLTASGANGLDTGAEGSSTWYYVWAILKADGTKDALFSTSSTAPTMPSGYTYKALIGAWYNDGSSNLRVARQIGDKVYYTTLLSLLSAGSATTETAITISAHVPSIAKKFWCVGRISGTNVANVQFRVVTGANYSYMHCFNGTVAEGSSSNHIFPNISQTLYYIQSTAAGSVTSYLDLQGFSL